MIRVQLSCVAECRRLFAAVLIAAAASSVMAQGGNATDGAAEPTWGRSHFQPTAANTVFATADGCSLCHSAAPTARALWSSTGQDVSPYGLWRGSLMAHAAKDPYWKAQVAKEVQRAPERAAETEGACIKCHAPMGHHTNRLAGLETMGLKKATSHPLYVDGVSCTVCHQIQPEGLGNRAARDRLGGGNGAVAVGG